MSETDLVLMSLVVFTPAAFALTLLLLPSRWTEAARWWALLGSALTLALTLCLWVDHHQMLQGSLSATGEPLAGPMRSLEYRAAVADRSLYRDVPHPPPSDDLLGRRPWVERLGVDYYLGVDGVNLPLIILTAFVVLLSVVASWKVKKFVKTFLACVLLLETGVLGAFLALDFFLFYVFYELMLVPMYFLIGVWGGERRRSAALKFFLYTLAGGAFILAALLACYFTDVRDFVNPQRAAAVAEDDQRLRPGQPGGAVHSFDLIVLQRAGRAAADLLRARAEVRAAETTPDDVARLDQARAALAAAEKRAPRADQAFFTEGFQYTVFVLLFLGFAVKVPLVPLHSWLPDAHVEAPTPVSMLLAGVLLKLGGYGWLRVAWPLCPWAAEQLAPWVVGLGAFAVVYGALAAMGQSDLKKLLAYSSVSHMGYVAVGLGAWASAGAAAHWALGVNGALFQMVAHGVTAAGLFFVAGVVAERTGTRDLGRLGGLMEPMPLFTGLSAVMFLAAMGLPGLCGFWGEFWVLLSAWRYHPLAAAPLVLTTVLTAGYMLWVFQRVYLGTSANAPTSVPPDLSAREGLVLGVFALVAIALGVLPGQLLVNWSEPAVTALVESLAHR